MPNRPRRGTGAALFLIVTILLAGCATAKTPASPAGEPSPAAAAAEATPCPPALLGIAAAESPTPSPSPTATATVSPTPIAEPTAVRTPTESPPEATPTEPVEPTPTESLEPPVESPTATPVPPAPAPAPAAPPPPTATRPRTPTPTRVVAPLPPAPPPLPASAGTSPYTGAPVVNGVASERRAIVVQVDNAPAARPQSGLSCADLVYETPTEAGWTRLTAFYHSRWCPVIGPIRSARLINIQLGQQYPTIVMAAGAADEVLELLDGRSGFTAVNLLRSGGGATFRDWDRPAPHNLYATLDDLRALGWRLGLDTPVRFAGPGFGDLSLLPGAAGLPGATTVTIPYRAASDVSYEYDPVTRQYRRWVNGAPHRDATTGQQLAARTVVVQWAAFRQTDIVEDVYGSLSLDVELLGTGPVVIYRDGKRIAGWWRRDAPGDVTRYYESQTGREIPLAPGGPTWVQLAPLGLPVQDDGP